MEAERRLPPGPAKTKIKADGILKIEDGIGKFVNEVKMQALSGDPDVIIFKKRRFLVAEKQIVCDDYFELPLLDGKKRAEKVSAGDFILVLEELE